MNRLRGIVFLLLVGRRSGSPGDRMINSVAAFHASVVNIVSSSNPKQAVQYILITPALVTDGIWNGGYARVAVNDGVPEYAGGLINQPYTSTYPYVLHTVKSGAGPAFTAQIQPRKRPQVKSPISSTDV